MEFTPEETATWGAVWRALRRLHATHACSEYREGFELCERLCGLCEQRVPQLRDLSNFLKGAPRPFNFHFHFPLHSTLRTRTVRTGFTIRPVAGYLSPRDFLSGLAFRVFFATQYLRHHSQPLYTPEPYHLVLSPAAACVHLCAAQLTNQMNLLWTQGHVPRDLRARADAGQRGVRAVLAGDRTRVARRVRRGGEAPRHLLLLLD